MGGGTELVLSMDDRIASTAPHTQDRPARGEDRPDPGLGRDPATAAADRPEPAIEMITSGEPVSAQKAVGARAWPSTPSRPSGWSRKGRRLIEYLQETGEWKARREQLRQPLGLDQDQMMFAFAVAEGLVKSKTKGQYPAPLAALKAIREGCNLPLEEGLKAEQKAVGEVVGSPILGNLIAIFFMKNRLSRDPGVDRPERHAPATSTRRRARDRADGRGDRRGARPLGHPTAMVDVDDARLADGLERASEVVMSRIKIGRATPQDMAKMLGHAEHVDQPVDLRRLRRRHRGGHRERGGSRRRSTRSWPRSSSDDAILASNTSTISITRLAESAPHPERFVGMHFFNPVDRMELVEVIRGEKTSDETVATVVALAKRIRKTPIVVRDCAGFLVNRVLLPYMNEALLLLQEGVPMDAIDEAATKFGMPMGPIALTTWSGWTRPCYAGKVHGRGLPRPGRAARRSWSTWSRRAARPEVGAPASAITQGQGRRPSPTRRSRRSSRSTRPASRPMDEEEITDRLFLPMLLEATRVLEEGIVREPGDVDMGLILGIGFPPFRGGILRWADTVGAGGDRRAAGEVRPARQAVRADREPARSWRKDGRDLLSRGPSSTPPLDRRPTDTTARNRAQRRRLIPMRHAVVIDAVRTPVGRASADKGYFRDVRAEDLSAHVIRALVERTGIDPKLIEDVRWGCVQQQGEQGFDIARIAALVAGLPIETAGVTINRNCASSLQAINDAAMSVAAGCEDVQIAGGVEHMDHVPMTKDYNPIPLLFRRHSEAIMNMGLTAEYLAAKYRISRGKQDEFALRSHQLAAAATDTGRVPGRDRPDLGPRRLGPQGPARPTDQCIRRDTSLEALSAPAAGVQPGGRLGHGGQQLADQRRGGGGAGDVGGEGPRAGPQADGAGPGDGRRRGRPRGDGHRAGARRPQGPEARRADARPDRLHRAERGVRRPGAVAC